MNTTEGRCGHDEPCLQSEAGFRNQVGYTDGGTLRLLLRRLLNLGVKEIRRTS
jgi:hypothetical protein